MSTGKPLTPVQRQCLKFALEHRKGIRRLPTWMTDKYLRKGDCPLFHYGIPLPVDMLIDYGAKNGLLDDVTDRIACFRAYPHIVSLLAERCHAPVKYATVSHPRHFGVVALHNNFNVNRFRRSSYDEEMILKNIRDELGLSPNSQPLWYYDANVPRTEDLDTRHTIPKVVMRHVKKKFGKAYLYDTADLESSDEELKAKLGPDLDSEFEAEDEEDEESGTEMGSCDGESPETEASDVENAMKT